MADTVESLNLPPGLRKMFNDNTEGLLLRHVRSAKHLVGLPELIKSGLCRSVDVANIDDASVVLLVLSAIAAAKNTLAELRVDIWDTDYDNFIVLLRECLRAHERSLESLTLRCRFSSSALMRVLEALPRRLKTLDLSENTINDSFILPQLVKYVQSSKLETLRLMNSNLKPQVLDDFVKLMCSIETPFTLTKIEGVDFHHSTEIPKRVRKWFTMPASLARKRQMNYKDRSEILKYDTSLHFLDYLRNVIFMKRLVGSVVRVWWPATEDNEKTSFSGRFWPARVLMVNPADLVFVVKYDNDEVDNVPCKYVQPLSPYRYGGGATRNYLQNFTGSPGFRTASGAPAPARAAPKEAAPADTDEVSTTPEHTYEQSTTSTLSPYTTRSPGPRDDEPYVCKNCGFASTGEAADEPQPSFDSVETLLGLEPKFMGNLLVPGEFCEFRDPLDRFRNDPSDYVALVTKVNEAEPLYECVCVYQDNDEYVSVYSKDIRRATVVPWYNWVELAFRLLNSPSFAAEYARPSLKRARRDSAEMFTITLESSEESTPDALARAGADWDDDRDANVFNPHFFHLPRVDLDGLTDYCPKNPLEMNLEPVEAYARALAAQVRGHSRLKGATVSYSYHDQFELKLKSLAEYNEVLQSELLAERNKNIELQSKLNCILCFEAQINCLLEPCSHFSFCNECAKNLKNCPVCRQPIERLRVLDLG